MNKARTEYDRGKINNKFQQFASDYEVDFKEQSASRSMIKAAAFPFVKELKDFDFEFRPSVNEQEMRELTNLGEDSNLFFQLTDMRYEKKHYFNDKYEF